MEKVLIQVPPGRIRIIHPAPEGRDYNDALPNMDVQGGGVALGRYRLGRLVGSGGMGEVYLARDLTLRRDVAIKFVTSAARASDTLTRRLIQEARAVAALDHPAICPVYDVGVDPSGRPYMVMQYVEGETLAARLGRGPMPIREALGTCERIAGALAVAHRRGIVHRDLKPQNVMLTASEQPKLLDFGIAKFLPALEDIAGDETTTSLTKAHALVGTPAYMSPEQIHNRPVDGRSDLFALGCILFECFTGRRTFDGRSTFEVLEQVTHTHPPAPSSIRSELDRRHDELCRRLLAKEPSDRFQSAEEVVGAIRLLLPDTSRSVDRDSENRGRRVLPRPSLRRAAVLGVLVAVVALAAAGLWQIWRPRLPVAPAEAQRFYQVGTDALREGAYRSAATALQEAVRLSPTYALAHARLAEAHAELDDGRAAEQSLVRLSAVIGNESGLPRDEQLRLEAIRSLVLGNVDQAVRAYGELAKRRPADASAWLDLGRAQEAAAQLADARDSYARAIAIDSQYAAGYLRLGSVQSAMGQHEQSLAAYSEAERLYDASSNTEGKIEVLIRRGALFNKIGESHKARGVLDDALSKANAIRNPFQVVRAQMQISSAIINDGRFPDAERLATTAVQTALEAGLDTAAADGLIDLALAIPTTRPADIGVFLEKATSLARRHGAQRTVARAASQMASLRLDEGRPQEALSTLRPALEFFEKHKYRTFEITALLIASRAYQGLDDLKQAHAFASTAMKEAEITKDDNNVAVALGNLAAQASVLGSLPEALGLRDRAEAIHRRQKIVVSLPFDLTNRAELYIALGRSAEADAALKEVDDGIARKVDVYVRRSRRVMFLRALSAAVSNDLERAARVAKTIPPEAGGTDSASILGPAILSYAEARRQRRAGRAATPPELPATTSPAMARERLFWLASAALSRGNAREALASASDGVKQAARVGNDELQWRLAAVASVAARVAGLTQDQRDFHTQAAEALRRVRSAWGGAARGYDNRPDLTALRVAADL